MENQHRKIKGYRELNQNEIDLMNEIKEQGVRLGELVKKVEVVNGTHDAGLEGEAYEQAIREHNDACDWINEARMDLKKGIMGLTRAVAKPGFF